MSSFQTYNKNKHLLTVLIKQISCQKTRNISFIFKKNPHIHKTRSTNFRFKSTNDLKQSSSLLTTSLKYVLTITLGASAGLLTGYLLILNSSKQNKDENDEINPVELTTEFQPTKYVKLPVIYKLLKTNPHTNFLKSQIENKDSAYSEFPLSIHLYQYECCPYCSQIRAYLDYFGFNYHLTEVDSYSKEELEKFTKARALPILVLEDKLNKKKWHLANATAILSALESVRNDKHINFSTLLNQYLPILKGNSVHNTINPYKYHVSNSDLNSIEWRKWINNNAIPAFKLNSIASLKDLYESFDYFSEKSHWKLRYNQLKYSYVYYSNMFKTYKQYSDILKRLDPEDRSKAPRQILHDTISKWEQGLGDKEFISGADKPNLADISMFGTARSYEGCALFRESIAKHPKFRLWYERMKLSVIKGFERMDRPTVGDLLYNQEEDNEDQVVLTEPEPEQVTETKVDDLNDTKPKLDKSSFRILTVNYLIHVLAFTYVAWK